MSEETKTILVFSAELQREVPHTLDIDGNGEVLLTCIETGRSLKYPAGTTAAQLKVMLAEHKAANQGQITQEKLDEEKAALLAGFDDIDTGAAV